MSIIVNTHFALRQHNRVFILILCFDNLIVCLCTPSYLLSLSLPEKIIMW